MVDPDDDTPIGNVYKEKSFLTAATTVPLFDLMDRFQTGKSKEYKLTFKRVVSRHVSRHLRETPMRLKMLITEKMYEAIKFNAILFFEKQALQFFWQQIRCISGYVAAILFSCGEKSGGLEATRTEG